MEIQQKKESLASYIHHFKREAKWCNFTNSAATIRIFIKGLKDTHTVTTRVYEKAAQQLTATLLPASTVNLMSHEEDWCFQCQESGHIAQHCPNVWCFECNEYGHIVVDCPHRIPPSGTPTCCHRQDSPPGIMPDQLLDTFTGTDTDTADQGCSPNHADIEVTVTTEAILGHIIETVDATIEALAVMPPQLLLLCCDTPHWRLSSHSSSWTHFRDCSRSRPCTAYKPSKKTLYKSSSHPSAPSAKSHDRKHPRVTIDDPQTDFYSSDDNSSDSNGDEDHLN